MRITLTIAFVLIQLLCFSQQKDSLNNNVAFTAKFNVNENAGKGNVYYLNNYVVHINWKKAQMLNGKTIKISGDVTLIKGLPNDGIIRQGSANDTKHILKPKIKIIEE